MKLNLMLQTWDMLFVARLLKKMLGKFNVTKLKYFVTQPSITKRGQNEACINACRIIKRKTGLFVSEQLGINCTCDQIGLVLISSHGQPLLEITNISIC